MDTCAGYQQEHGGTAGLFCFFVEKKGGGGRTEVYSQWEGMWEYGPTPPKTTHHPPHTSKNHPPTPTNTTSQHQTTQQVLVRVRLHNSRSKGKSAFLVFRQLMSTVQAVLFVDNTTVSKGMVKYAAGIPKESIVDVEAKVVCPEALVEGCTQNEVCESICVCWLRDSTAMYVYHSATCAHP